MTYYPDLATKGFIVAGEQVRSVGWLDSTHSFSVGVCPTGLVEQLERHISMAWLPRVSCGFHECSFCHPGSDLPPVQRPRATAGQRITAGTQLVLIPGNGFLYSAPDLITHYIRQHGYLPPQEFVDAVNRCPDQGTPPYIELMKPFLHLWKIDEEIAIRIAGDKYRLPR